MAIVLARLGNKWPAWHEKLPGVSQAKYLANLQSHSRPWSCSLDIWIPADCPKAATESALLACTKISHTPTVVPYVLQYSSGANFEPSLPIPPSFIPPNSCSHPPTESPKSTRCLSLLPKEVS